MTGGVGATPPAPKPFVARRLQAKREVGRSGASRRSRLPVAFAAFEWGKLNPVTRHVASLHFNRYDQIGVKKTFAMLRTIESNAL